MEEDRNYEIVELTDYSGKEAKIYSIRLDGESETLFEQFVRENHKDFIEELQDISSRLHIIGHHYGARVSYFKENEGRFGDSVCALYDTPGKNLRLYCMRFGTVVLVIFGGRFQI
jgi:hypothetical protein